MAVSLGCLRASVSACLLIGLAAAPAFSASPAPQADVARDQDLRLETIGYRLAIANGSRCDGQQMLTGLLFHDIGAYELKDRPAISRVYGLGKGFGIRGVVPESLAEQAGLRTGDEITAVNGVDLDAFSPELIRRTGSYDRTEAFIAYLDAALRQGPALLSVRRGDDVTSVRLAGAPGCGGRFAVQARSDLNAWSDGRYVAVTTRMMDFAADDQELAFVVAHEMAHNILKHAEQSSGVTRLLAQFAVGAGKIKKSELAADELGVELFARAGYDLSAPERILRRAAKSLWWNIAFTHPGTTRRVEQINATIVRLHQADAPPARLLTTARGTTPSP
ncbi:M48 family metalloprotease [Sphingobium lignivorans]|uniref:PDZ domain-containing protein n=1 Tax=Sphingobium lignivorans TaxID=2735886 RepID=A0ABR6NHL4_9SPHN|nr:M48 family metalloprotease [Sphingobium lignivorans]MBB5986122.1 hypothetical protein [Sphingobium lignivorans]